MYDFIVASIIPTIQSIPKITKASPDVRNAIISMAVIDANSANIGEDVLILILVYLFYNS